MARRIRSNNDLTNRTNRLEQPVTTKPIFVLIAPNISIGYRRNAKVSGSWSVKVKRTPEWTRKFATADDYEPCNGETVMSYEQALAKALDLARDGEGNSGAMDTVFQALGHYEEALVAAGLSKYNASTLKVRHLPKALASKPVSLLKSRDVTSWLTFMLKEQGLKSSSAERYSKSLVAALNLAADEDSRITNRKVWKGLAAAAAGVQQDNDDDAEVIRDGFILPDHVISNIVHACHEDSVKPDDLFGLLVETLADTGVRASQVLRLKPKHLLDDDLETACLSMPMSRKGSTRKKRRLVEYNPIPISPRLAMLLRQRANACKPNDPLLGRPMDDFPDRFRVVVKRLGLDSDLTPYCLRYSSIARQLAQRMDPTLTAKNHDTSIAVIQAFYARHIAKTKRSDAATRATLIDHGTGPISNVVPLVGRKLAG